jgi:hypothetical protein
MKMDSAMSSRAPRRASLKQDPAGATLSSGSQPNGSTSIVATRTPACGVFAQKSLEDRLDAGLGAIWPLWRDRENLRARALTDLYLLRNEALGIKRTTIRRMIPARYERNMVAFKQFLKMDSCTV